MGSSGRSSRSELSRRDESRGGVARTTGGPRGELLRAIAADGPYPEWREWYEAFNGDVVERLGPADNWMPPVCGCQARAVDANLSYRERPMICNTKWRQSQGTNLLTRKKSLKRKEKESVFQNANRCLAHRAGEGTVLRCGRGCSRGERVSGIKDGAVKKTGSRRDLNFPAAGGENLGRGANARGGDGFRHDVT